MTTRVVIALWALTREVNSLQWVVGLSFRLLEAIPKSSFLSDLFNHPAEEGEKSQKFESSAARSMQIKWELSESAPRGCEKLPREPGRSPFYEKVYGKSKLYTTGLGDWHSLKQVQPPCHARSRVLENTCKQVNELAPGLIAWQLQWRVLNSLAAKQIKSEGKLSQVGAIKLQTGLPLFRPMWASSVQCRHWSRHMAKASFIPRDMPGWLTLTKASAATLPRQSARKHL